MTTKRKVSENHERGRMAREIILDHLKENVDKEFTAQEVEKLLPEDLAIINIPRLMRALFDKLVRERSEYRLKITKITSPGGVGGRINIYTLIRK